MNDSTNLDDNRRKAPDSFCGRHEHAIVFILLLFGKDEVASSNLAINSIRPSEMTVFLLYYGV